MRLGAAGGPDGVSPLLEIHSLDFSYGPLQVLFDVSLAVAPGARVALLGTNGAGKSTLLKVIAGLQFPQRGNIVLGGEEITRLPADQRVRRGLTLIEGGRAMFPSLTVAENLEMGAYLRRRGDRITGERTEEVLELFPTLRGCLSQTAGSLSGGEEQMVALGRALVAGPELLIIDELSLGLAPVVMQDILRAVEALTARGVTLLLVEQSLNIALSLSERAFFMEKGEVKFSGPTADLLERGDLVRSVFFGRDGGSTVSAATR
ncbi:MAG: ABC transporter ATP-binding protein [Acidimicrobiales bacterium]